MLENVIKQSADYLLSIQIYLTRQINPEWVFNSQKALLRVKFDRSWGAALSAEVSTKVCLPGKRCDGAKFAQWRISPSGHRLFDFHHVAGACWQTFRSTFPRQKENISISTIDWSVNLSRHTWFDCLMPASVWMGNQSNTRRVSPSACAHPITMAKDSFRGTWTSLNALSARFWIDCESNLHANFVLLSSIDCENGFSGWTCCGC